MSPDKGASTAVNFAGTSKNPQGSSLAPKRILNRFLKAKNHVFLLKGPRDALKSSRRRRCRR